MDCKPFLSKNGRFIYLRPKPLFDKPNSLKVYLKKARNEYSMPVATCDILRGKTRYYFDKDMIGIIDSFEVL